MIPIQRRRVLAVVALTFLFCTPLLAADSAPPTATSLPDYMEHWEFGMDVNEDQGPRYLLDPIIPLAPHSKDAKDVAFLEPRMTYRDHEWLLNLGGGYRRLVLNRAWLLGGNLFYDFESEHAHSRVGLGAEALSSFAELRSNVYVPTSGERTVEENSGGITYERAVHGFDMEVGAPVPYYSRLKLFGGFNWYDQPHFKNRYGWTLRAEYKPVPFIVIDGTVSDNTKTNVDWGMKVALRIPFGGNVEHLHAPTQLDPTMFPESDASVHFWDLVERHHEIVVERRRNTGTISVQVSRGT